MIMRYDGVLGAGQKRTGLVGLNDIYATLSDFVGFDIPDGSAQDSISFADHALTELKDSPREHFGVWHWPSKSQALHWGNFKYVVRYGETTEKYLFDLNTDVKEERNLLREGSKKYNKLYTEMSEELRRFGACPLDEEEPFLITYGPVAGSTVTCDYFRDDPSRCEDQVLGELNCNSVCGRFRNLCKLHDGLGEDRSYPERTLSQEPSSSPIEQDFLSTSPSFSPTLSSSAPSSLICQDDKDFELVDENVWSWNCAWVSVEIQRINTYCQNEDISNACKSTCGKCPQNCVNTDGFTFFNSKGEKDCSWLCKNRDIQVVENRQSNNCKGDVLENCCEACKAGPRCT